MIFFLFGGGGGALRRLPLREKGLDSAIISLILLDDGSYVKQARY
jgi:hypothetical protein